MIMMILQELVYYSNQTWIIFSILYYWMIYRWNERIFLPEKKVCFRNDIFYDVTTPSTGKHLVNITIEPLAFLLTLFNGNVSVLIGRIKLTKHWSIVVITKEWWKTISAQISRFSRSHLIVDIKSINKKVKGWTER